LGGRIAFNRQYSTMDCVVRNLSPNGAKLLFSGPVAIPARFELVLPARDESRDVLVVWRSPAEVGVFFDERRSGSVISLEAARRIRRLEAERGDLLRRLAQLTE
jgi:hypothetical protein